MERKDTMPEFVRCKACGYVTTRGRLKDVCPACGVPAKMFEPYTHTVSLKRRRILDLHTHPVLVHFPQAFALTLCGLSFLVFFMSGKAQEAIFSTLRVLSLLLPLTVIFAIITGVLDGKIRFRKVTTPLLKKKIVLSVIFFLAALAMAALAACGDIQVFSLHLSHFLLGIVVTLCGTLLGLIGGTLLDSKFPG
jgi:uncharacterized membrane protein